MSDSLYPFVAPKSLPAGTWEGTVYRYRIGTGLITLKVALAIAGVNTEKLSPGDKSAPIRWSTISQ